MAAVGLAVQPARRDSGVELGGVRRNGLQQVHQM